MSAELHAAYAVMERGVRAKVRAPLFLRLIGIKSIPITLRKLYAGTLFRVSAIYLSTGITAEDLKETSTEHALELMHKHGDAIYQAVACALINSKLLGRLFTKWLARYLKENLTLRETLLLLEICLVYNGVADFMNTTRLVRALKITDPNLGQKENTKGS
jgi:hypothetical protein